MRTTKDRIIAHELGSLDEAETVILFQELTDTGLVWSLNGKYVQKVRDLIGRGLVKCPNITGVTWTSIPGG